MTRPAARARARRACALLAVACMTAAMPGCSVRSVIDVMQGCKYADTTQSAPAVVVAAANAANPAAGTGTLGTLRDATGGDAWENMTTTETMNRYNGGTDESVCSRYADGQCTWWACMRGRRLGIDVGSYWGNGGDWAASGRAAGYRTTSDQPVAGALVSYPPGVQGADRTYGHVAVVEAVDSKAGSVLISEMNVKGPIATSRVLPINGGAVYILPDKTSSASKHDKTTKTDGADTKTAGTGTKTASGPATAATTRDPRSRTPDPQIEAAWTCSSTAAAPADTSGAQIELADYKGDGRHATPDQAKAIAMKMLKEHYTHWDTQKEYEALEWVWEHESGWRWDAENPSSGAYGIPQSLPGDKMATKGDDWSDNAATQIAWGLEYIEQRYKTPTGAKQWWLSHNWY